MTTSADLTRLGLRELAMRVAARQVSPVDVVEATLTRIRRLQPVLNAFIAVFDEAIERARAMERRQSAGAALGPLHGTAISVKDLVLTRDAPTTAGSRTFGRGIASRSDAPAVRRLRRAGAVVIGKTNLHEIALGVTSENEHFGPVRNPWNRHRIAGGSSGGSAAALAGGLGCGSVGTDTRGSIRIPAAYCGITGLKPTRDLVPTEGVIPLSWTLDHVGPMTRSVEDAALMLGVMTGRRALLRRYLDAVDGLATPRTLGICDYYYHNVDPEIERAVQEAVRQLRRLGHSHRSVAVPGLADTQAASTIITLAEALTYHDERLRDEPEGFGALIRNRLEPGYALTALDLTRATRRRLAVEREFARAFEQVDCLVAPTVPVLPRRIDEPDVGIVDALTRLNSPQNMAGLPALSLPCGFSSSGLPIGLQLIAPAGRDEIALSLGAAYQRETDWHRRRPPLLEDTS